MYDPDRFGPGREEDKQKPFSFIGFGGGRHSCMGETFAYMQVKVLKGEIPEPDYTAMVVGPKPPLQGQVHEKVSVERERESA